MNWLTTIIAGRDSEVFGSDSFTDGQCLAGQEAAAQRSRRYRLRLWFAGTTGRWEVGLGLHVHGPDVCDRVFGRRRLEEMLEIRDRRLGSGLRICR